MKLEWLKQKDKSSTFSNHSSDTTPSPSQINYHKKIPNTHSTSVVSSVEHWHLLNKIKEGK